MHLMTWPAFDNFTVTWKHVLRNFSEQWKSENLQRLRGHLFYDSYFLWCPQKITNVSEVSRVFLGRLEHTLNPWQLHHVLHQAEKFKFVTPNALKMHSLALSVLRFLCKTFSKLIKFTLRNTLLCGWLFKKSYIQ